MYHIDVLMLPYSLLYTVQIFVVEKHILCILSIYNFTRISCGTNIYKINCRKKYFAL